MHSLMTAHFCTLRCQDVTILVYWRSRSFPIQAVMPVYKNMTLTGNSHNLSPAPMYSTFPAKTLQFAISTLNKIPQNKKSKNCTVTDACHSSPAPESEGVKYQVHFFPSMDLLLVHDFIGSGCCLCMFLLWPWSLISWLVYADVIKSSCDAPLVALIQKEPPGGSLR